MKTGFDIWTDDFAAQTPQTRPADHRPAEVVAEDGAHRRTSRLRFLDIIASFVLWPWDAFIALTGFEIVEGEFHEDCGDVHLSGDCRLPQTVADCDVCLRTVDVDRFGNCINAGSKYRNHTLRQRRAKGEAR